MSDKTKRLEELRETASTHLASIASLFKPGAKVTLLVRRPEQPNGSQDFLLTDEDAESMDEALTSIDRLVPEPGSDGHMDEFVGDYNADPYARWRRLLLRRYAREGATPMPPTFAHTPECAMSVIVERGCSILGCTCGAARAREAFAAGWQAMRDAAVADLNAFTHSQSDKFDDTEEYAAFSSVLAIAANRIRKLKMPDA